MVNYSCYINDYYYTDLWVLTASCSNVNSLGRVNPMQSPSDELISAVSGAFYEC